jgi:hypothetical protein
VLVSSTLATAEGSQYAYQIASIDAAAFDANASATLVIVATPLAGALVLLAVPTLVLDSPDVYACAANRPQCVGPVFQVCNPPTVRAALN